MFGIVGDLSLAVIDGDVTKDTTLPGPPAAFEVEYDWLATIRARAGMLVTDDMLLYVTGGVAFADINLNGIGGAGPWANVRESGVETGWTVGGGAEMAMTESISLFAEALYMDFSSATHTPAGPPGSIDYDSELFTAKLGVNWNF